MGWESVTEPEELEALTCYGGATSSLSSSFSNCAEIRERVVVIQTAQLEGGTTMLQHMSQYILCSRSNRRDSSPYDRDIYSQISQA